MDVNRCDRRKLTLMEREEKGGQIQETLDLMSRVCRTERSDDGSRRDDDGISGFISGTVQYTTIKGK